MMVNMKELWAVGGCTNSRVCCCERRFGGLSLHEGSDVKMSVIATCIYMYMYSPCVAMSPCTCTCTYMYYMHVRSFIIFL